MDYMWIIQDLFTTGPFIVLGERQKRKENDEDGLPGRYVKLVLCLASWFKGKIISLVVNSQLSSVIVL